MNFPRLLVACLVVAGGCTACAQDSEPAPGTADPVASAPKMDPVSPADIERVRGELAKLLPEIKAENIHASAAPGLFEIQQGSQYGYVTADGKYLIQGDMVNLETGEEITENLRKSARVAKIEALGEDNMIVFAPANAADRKYTVTVFTDVDCGYCRKLHSEIAQYTQQGIAIRYLFYPRTGPDSPSFQKAEAVWCATDRKNALTIAKMGAPVDMQAKCENPIMREWRLGQELELRGTPMMVLSDGEIINGYVPAPELAQRLASRQKVAAAAAPEAGTKIQ